ncbi:MAG: hypothetical protein SPG65_00345 [Campylobacter sp.]|nr:hypothetical protein [Campylobacter sp.]
MCLKNLEFLRNSIFLRKIAKIRHNHSKRAKMSVSVLMYQHARGKAEGARNSRIS